MKIYIVVRNGERNLSQILGAFKDKSMAISCCKKQPTFTRQGWIEIEGQDIWHNGHGLCVEIISCEVQ